MSTASEIGRMPRSTSRRCIHSGDRAVGSRPVTVRSTSRSTAEAGSATSPGGRCRRSAGLSGAGSRSADAVRRGGLAGEAADRQAYPRSGVTAMSSTSSRSPSSSTASAPTSGSPSSTRMPVWSSPMPSSRDEQIMPSLTWPYVFRAVMAKPPGSVAPGRATTTRSPTAKLRAPQTMPRGRCRRADVDLAPADRSCRWTRSRSSNASDPADDQRAGDVVAGLLDGLDLEAGGDQPLGQVAAGDRRRAGRRTRAARTAGPASDLRPERQREAHVALDHVAHVLGPVAGHQRALQADAEREPGPPSGSTPQARRTRGLTMPQPPSSIQPSTSRCGRAGRVADGLPVADPAAQVHLGAGLGEGEVRRPQPGRDVSPNSDRAKCSSVPLAGGPS